MTETKPIIPKNRLYLGGAIFLFGVLSPIFVPLVAATGLSTAWKATLSGLLMLGIPELFMLIAAAVLGKAGFSYLKSLMLSLLKKHVVPEQVSPSRYRVGLFIFFFPVLWGWIAPYLLEFVSIHEYRLTFAIVGDLMLLTGLILLGGEFWEKLRSLFLHRAVVSMAEEP